MKAYNFNLFPELFSERLMLRKLNPSDNVQIFGLRSDSNMMKYLDQPLMQNIDEADDLIQKVTTDLVANVGITWGITLKDEDELVGTIGFWKMYPEHARAEIGYTLHTDFQGRGLMQEALSTVIHFGFAELQLHSIEANVNPGNEASIKLLEKNGFLREGYFRENYFFDGKFIDTAIYSLIRPAHIIH